MRQRGPFLKRVGLETGVGECWERRGFLKYGLRGLILILGRANHGRVICELRDKFAVTAKRPPVTLS